MSLVLSPRPADKVPGRTMTRKHMSQGAGAQGPNMTFHSNWTCETAFTRVRFGFANHQAVPVTIEKIIACAPAAIDADGFSPRNASNVVDHTLWKPMLTNGLRPITVPAGVGSSPNYQFGMAVTDWLDLASLDRLDGSPLRYLMVRFFNATGGSTMNYFSLAAWANWASVAQGRINNSFNRFNNSVDTPTNMTGAAALNGMAPAWVEVDTGKPGLTFTIHGNSTFQGYLSTSDHDSWGHKAACLLSGPDFPVSCVNWGVAGSVPSAYLGNAATFSALSNVDVAIIEIASPNQVVDTQAKADAAWTAAMAAGAFYEARGVRAAYATPQPWKFSTDTYRQQLVTRALALRSSGVLVADFDAVMRDPAAPQNPLLSQIISGSDSHPNNYGNTLLAGQLIKDVLLPLKQAYTTLN